MAKEMIAMILAARVRASLLTRSWLASGSVQR